MGLEKGGVRRNWLLFAIGLGWALLVPFGVVFVVLFFSGIVSPASAGVLEMIFLPLQFLLLAVNLGNPFSSPLFFLITAGPDVVIAFVLYRRKSPKMAVGLAAISIANVLAFFLFFFIVILLSVLGCGGGC